MTKKKTPADKLRDSLKTITGSKDDNVIQLDEARAAREGNDWDLEPDDGPPDLVELRLTRNQICSTLAGIDPKDNRNKAKVAGALRHMFPKHLDIGRVFYKAWLASEGDEITAENSVDLYDKLSDNHAYPAHWRSLIKAAKGCEPVDAMSRLDSASFTELELLGGMPEAFVCQVIGRGFIEFPVMGESGPITTGLLNAYTIFDHYGLKHRFNDFALRTCVNGKPYVDGDVYRSVDIAHKHGFRANERLMRTAAYARAHNDHYHPVLERFAALPAWDKIKRLDRFASHYLGAADTKLHSALGVLIFVALIRRVKQPGCKFDMLPVLCGPQGIGKSLALRKMALHDEWFTDCVNVGEDPKKVQEQTAGRLIVECAEMAGQTKKDVETVKTFVSRQSDDTRKAHGYERTDAPRQFVAFGSTNRPRFLVDDTGNRRFPTIDCGQIKIAELERDIEQLYAEALLREMKFGILDLPANLKAEAGEQAEAKRLVSAIEEKATEIFERFAYGKIQTDDIYRYLELRSPVAQAHAETVAKVAQSTGWTKTRLRKKEEGRVYCYAKGNPEQLALDTSWIDVTGLGPYNLAYKPDL